MSVSRFVISTSETVAKLIRLSYRQSAGKPRQRIYDNVSAGAGHGSPGYGVRTGRTRSSNAADGDGVSPAVENVGPRRLGIPSRGLFRLSLHRVASPEFGITPAAQGARFPACVLM